jgi:cystathionine beta-lyase
MSARDLSDATRLTALGRDPAAHEGAVNPPVQRGSTVIVPRAADLYDDARKTYGLEGFSTQERLAEALAGLSGGVGAVLAPSGLSALTLALLTYGGQGAHVLVTDSAYGPTRRFCDQVLSGHGVRTTYFDPRIGAGIAGLLTPHTRLIVLESPGSLTFEIQDVPAIAAVARAAGVTTLIDDTWSAGLWMKPFDLGVDISMQALTKYQGGHADVLAGALICADEGRLARLTEMHKLLGLFAGAEDCALALRGMRTMAVRMAHQDRTARALAIWLEARPEVERVIHPALPSHPDHALWARDFTGAGGLFGFTLKPVPRERVHAFLERCRLFSMGFSWGGFESLILPCDPQIRRTAVPWRENGPLLRISAGLEDVGDLIADLDQAFAALA